MVALKSFGLCCCSFVCVGEGGGGGEEGEWGCFLCLFFIFIDFVLSN